MWVRPCDLGDPYRVSCIPQMSGLGLRTLWPQEEGGARDWPAHTRMDVGTVALQGRNGSTAKPDREVCREPDEG